MRDVVRRPLPCLAIPVDAVSEKDLKALWKAMDTDRSSSVTVQEFMVFMRRYGPKKHMQWTSSKMLAASANMNSRREQMSVAKARQEGLSDAEMMTLCDALGQLSETSLAEAYQTWGFTWAGHISEWDWLKVIRELLGLTVDQLDDDAVHVVWKRLDPTCVGRVDAPVVLSFGQEGQKAPQLS